MKPIPRQRLHNIVPAFLALCFTLIFASTASAFSALVSPPRFEINAKSGQTLREIVELSHVDGTPGGYTFATADWQLEGNGTVTFKDALATDSCRPWVAIERRHMTLPANGRAKFRVEITVPANARAKECRFALLVQGDDQAAATAGLPVPIAGRIAVIFYVVVGDAKPLLDFKPLGVQLIEQMQTPVLRVTNSGEAHGRVGGVMNGIDAKGRKFEFVPTSLPILAGETRDVALMPNVVGGGPANPALPVRVTGKLEWGNASTALDHEFSAPK